VQQEKAKANTAKYLTSIPADTIPVFVDGSALGNPGLCGAAAIVYSEGLSCEPICIAHPISKRSTSYHGEMKGLEIGSTSSYNIYVHTKMISKQYTSSATVRVQSEACIAGNH